MRADAVSLEAGRMNDLTIENYPWIHERHRVFPQVFEDRKHRRIIDLSAGIGIIAKRIRENYDCELVCNEIDKSCLQQLNTLDVKVTSFDLDTNGLLPLESNSFDAVLCLATLEHIIHTDNFIKEMHRILDKDGRLYLTVPNYSSIYYLIPLLKGRTFNNPLDPIDQYEFYAHVRYFAYHTLIDLFNSFDFHVDTVYLALPKESSRYQKLKEQSRFKAFLFRNGARLIYSLSPRWHPGPLMCFSKANMRRTQRIKLI